MKTCKNTECTKPVKKGRTYCSVRCKNVVYNKENNAKRNKKIKEQNIAKYNLSPKICPTCNSALAYSQRRYTYCSRKCIPKEGLNTLTKEQLQKGQKKASQVKKVEL